MTNVDIDTTTGGDIEPTTIWDMRSVVDITCREAGGPSLHPSICMVI